MYNDFYCLASHSRAELFCASKPDARKEWPSRSFIAREMKIGGSRTRGWGKKMKKKTEKIATTSGCVWTAKKKTFLVLLFLLLSLVILLSCQHQSVRQIDWVDSKRSAKRELLDFFYLNWKCLTLGFVFGLHVSP